MSEYSQSLDSPPKFNPTYVIWGDLDTIWLKDFDSCSLAKPTILSVTGYESLFCTHTGSAS